jgi:outer membrane protein assembly factor BamB
MSRAVSAPPTAGGRPIVPLILVALGLACYFTGWLILNAPDLLPMMAAIMAAMLGPQVCALLLGVWFVAQPLVVWLFGRSRLRREPRPATTTTAAAASAPAVVAAATAGGVGSTDVMAPGPVMHAAAAQAPAAWDVDAPAAGGGGGFGAALRTAALRFGVVLLLAAVCVGAVVAAEVNTRFFFSVWGVPLALALMTVALVALFRAPRGVSVAVAALLFVAAIAPWELIRTKGVTGKFNVDPAWRWSLTAEEEVARYEDAQSKAAKALGDAPIVAGEGDSPGFRGPGRDGRAPALKGTKFTKAWAHKVGPGWGSVSGAGGLLFTQDQRKEGERVVCYDLEDGGRRWAHLEPSVRHADPQSGPGPRGTPTFHDGKVYALGGTGVLLRLDARSGEPDWKVSLTEDHGCKQLVFGFSCSPLVHKGKVYVSPGSAEGPLLVAFDAKSGKKLWSVGEQPYESYSSPQLAKLAGVEQVLVFGSAGLTGHDPETGAELWRYEWKSAPTAQPSIQPGLLSGDRVLVGGAQPGTGFRCVKVSKDSGGEWSAAEEWKTRKVSPRFNDVVYLDEHLYGLDMGSLFCLDASNGKVAWKTGSAYGAGQVLLAGRRLLVQSEEGTLSWCDATPQGPPTLTEVKALSDKTWNHPAVVRGRVILRNATEMMCFTAE